MNSGSSFGVVGVFWILLGVGLILDADWIRLGSCFVASGAWCLWMERHRSQQKDETSA